MRVAGDVLAQRIKGAVTWQARISHDRGRLELVGIVGPSTTPTVIEPLTPRELIELLEEHDGLRRGQVLSDADVVRGEEPQGSTVTGDAPRGQQFSGVRR
jgi:hypothetical protein